MVEDTMQTEYSYLSDRGHSTDRIQLFQWQTEIEDTVQSTDCSRHKRRELQHVADELGEDLKFGYCQKGSLIPEIQVFVAPDFLQQAVFKLLLETLW